MLPGSRTREPAFRALVIPGKGLATAATCYSLAAFRTVELYKSLGGLKIPAAAGTFIQFHTGK